MRTPDADRLPTAFYVQTAPDHYQATALTIGPWDKRFQHGGPPAALVAGAMARFEGGADYALARLTLELLRPVPVAELRLEVDAAPGGSRVQRLRARLFHGERLLVDALGLRLRREAIDLGRPAVAPGPAGAAPAPWAPPAELPIFEFPFFHEPIAYHRAIEARVAHGRWGSTPVGMWARQRVPLVDGRPLHPVERVLVLADAQSGMGVPLDPLAFTFINPDLTVYFEREPAGEWLGFDIRSVAGAGGMGLSQSEVRDHDGIVARSAQSLVVGPAMPPAPPA